MLEVTHLAVDHGKLRALWDVSFRVDQGERVGLLGANGAGKSTTLGAIIGLYGSSGGDVRYLGEPIANRPLAQNVLRGIAIVPEGRRLFPEMSVQDNLELGCFLPQKRRQVSQHLERVFTLFPILATKSRQMAGELSGGQQQMAAIGRALMSDPKLLLLDEPFIGVAPLVIDEVMGVLRQIATSGVTIVLVEQNIHRALDFVHRAYVIENGRTVLDGTREQLLEDTSFSSKFLGLD